MRIGRKNFDLKQEVYVMGILNVTPDSFSDGGSYNNMDAALAHAQTMIKEGAHIIDVGGESTRPGYTMLTDEEEILRVVPIIEEMKRRFDIPISIDTYKSRVAKAAIEAGADLVNDIWGLKYDQKMAAVIGQAKVPCCLMHNRNMPFEDGGKSEQEVFMKEVLDDLEKTLQIAKKAGIEEDKIILDPGIGFGKTYQMNLQVMNHLDRLLELGYPILLGASRKSMIGLTLDLPVDKRLEGTLVTTVLGVLKGCSFVRVHDVKENIRAIKMTKAILMS